MISRTTPTERSAWAFAARCVHGRYNAGRVKNELKALFHNDAYPARAMAVAERVRSEDGVGAACDAIEEVLAAPDSFG